MPEIALKPCPFCGNPTPTIVENGIGDLYVICQVPWDDDPYQDAGCGARTSDVGCETEIGAAERWNRRSPPWF